MNKLISFILVVLACCATKRSYAEEVVLYGTFPDSYQFKLLKHALSYRPEKHHQLINFEGKMPKQRAFDFMNEKQFVDVIIAGSTLEREQINLPVRIPVLKGLNGWRIPLVNKQQPRLFANIDSLAQFKQLVPGQYHSWSDTKILAHNGIQVEKGSLIEGLFHMLEKQRFDYFPRSVLEVFQEYEERKTLNIAIDNTSMIYYPTAYYFYVAKNNQSLADDILFGLESALADGSFDQLFYQHFGTIIENIRQQKRKVFSLVNPLLPDETPLSRQELWINLSPSAKTIFQ